MFLLLICKKIDVVINKQSRRIRLSFDYMYIHLYVCMYVCINIYYAYVQNLTCRYTYINKYIGIYFVNITALYMIMNV